MNTREALNRGFNLLSTSISALAGFAFAPEAIFETDMPDKIDDTLLFVLALVALWWYNRSTSRYARSVMPVVLVVLALVVKVGGLIIEWGDPESMGDDFGGIILFVLATGLVIFQYIRTGKLLSQAQS